MADWQNTLDLADFYRSDKLTIQEKAELVVQELKRLLENSTTITEDMPEYDEGLDIIDSFEALASDSSGTVEDFDYVMEELYNWADTPLSEGWNGKKLCWVKTF